ncbi:hypothetical protein HDU98_011539 [Podochytrium sp. JEL0797]|nr:hypothetical protein HDU98_011539 [Podochytrium sp. JEL0797]
MDTQPPSDIGATFASLWHKSLAAIGLEHGDALADDQLFEMLRADPTLQHLITPELMAEHKQESIKRATNDPEYQLGQVPLPHPDVKGEHLDADGVLCLANYDFNNWGITQSAALQVAFFPQSVKAVQEIVRWSNSKKLRVRCSGFRHSWSNIFSDDAQVLISFVLPANLGPPTIHAARNPSNSLQVIQEATDFGDGCFKIGAAVTNEHLREFCIKNGHWSMPFNVIMVEITVGGSNAPICHGGGLTSKTLSDLVVAMEVVNMHGDLMLITDPQELAAASGCFGVLGPVVSLVLQLSPMELALIDPKRIPRESMVPRQTSGPEWDEFVSQAQKYYSEFFHFPFNAKGWRNCWDKAPLSFRKPSDPPIADFPLHCDAEIQNLETYVQDLADRDLFKLLPGKLQAQIVGSTAIQVLPASPKMVYLHDALHFTRGINNLRVNDMEFEVRIPESKTEPGKPDWTLCSRLWWAAIDLVEALPNAPVRVAVEMRITGTSGVVLAPQRGNTFGTCSIEILTTKHTVTGEEWADCKQKVFEAWTKVAHEYGVVLLPHFAKEWSGLKVKEGGQEVKFEQHLRDALMPERLQEFRTTLDKIGARVEREQGVGFTAQSSVDKFSNEFLRWFLLRSGSINEVSESAPIPPQKSKMSGMIEAIRKNICLR